MKEAVLNFFSITGRANREKFNIPYFICLAINYSISGYLYFLSTKLEKIIKHGLPLTPAEFSRFENILFFSTFVLISTRLLLVPLMIRRLHDLNRPGTLVLISIFSAIYAGLSGYHDLPIPRAINIISGLFHWYLILYEGTKGPNQYGDDPLRPTTIEEE